MHALLKAGVAKVYAAARDVGSLEQTRALDASRVVPVALDIGDSSAIERVAAAAGDTTLLINNAAILEFGQAQALRASVLRRHFDVNVLGMFEMTRAFAGAMDRSGGGAVVNVLSLIALCNAPAMAAYSASKAAAWSLTQSFRSSLGPRGIDVHAVFPGAVDTDMLARLDMPKASPFDVATAIVSGVHAGEQDIFPDAQSPGWLSRQAKVAGNGEVRSR